MVKMSRIYFTKYVIIVILFVNLAVQAKFDEVFWAIFCLNPFDQVTKCHRKNFIHFYDYCIEQTKMLLNSQVRMSNLIIIYPPKR